MSTTTYYARAKASHRDEAQLVQDLARILTVEATYYEVLPIWMDGELQHYLHSMGLHSVSVATLRHEIERLTGKCSKRPQL